MSPRECGLSSQLDRNRLYFGVLLEGILTHFPPNSRLLEAAKGSGCVENVEAVHPNSAGPDVIGDGVSFANVPGPNSSGRGVG
jgi:hypothetical protein